MRYTHLIRRKPEYPLSRESPSGPIAAAASPLIPLRGLSSCVAPRAQIARSLPRRKRPCIRLQCKRCPLRSASADNQRSWVHSIQSREQCLRRASRASRAQLDSTGARTAEALIDETCLNGYLAMLAGMDGRGNGSAVGVRQDNTYVI